MYDYAQVQLLGRATEDAVFLQSGEEDRINKANFSIALNIPIRRQGEIVTKTIYRKVMVLGSYANYVAKCQDQDGLKGRLINVVGIMDDEASGWEVVRVAPGAGFIKVMDRKSK